MIIINNNINNNNDNNTYGKFLAKLHIDSVSLPQPTEAYKNDIAGNPNT